MRKSSKRKYDSYRGVDKTILVDFIFKKIKGVEKKHILPVINIMLDLMLEDLFSGKEIKISNFTRIKISRFPSKLARNYYTGQMIMTKPYNKLNFKLDNNLSKYLKSNLDLEKYTNE